MMRLHRSSIAMAIIFVSLAVLSPARQSSPSDMVARIREEGFQRSQVMDIVGYMTDVLGARLTLSRDMQRAQVWAKDKMEKVGLFERRHRAVHGLRGSLGQRVFLAPHARARLPVHDGLPARLHARDEREDDLPAVIAEIQTKKDLEKFKGKLKGMAVLASPPVAHRSRRHAPGRHTAHRRGAQAARGDRDRRRCRRRSRPSRPIPTSSGPRIRSPSTRPRARRSSFSATAAAFGVVRGFGRPGVNADRWSREKDLASMPLVAGDARALQPDGPDPAAGHPGQDRGRGAATASATRSRRRPTSSARSRERPQGRGRHDGRPLRLLARQPRRERRRRRLRRRARGGPHPQGDRRSSPGGRSASPSGEARSRASTARASTS